LIVLVKTRGALKIFKFSLKATDGLNCY